MLCFSIALSSVVTEPGSNASRADARDSSLLERKIDERQAFCMLFLLHVPGRCER